MAVRWAAALFVLGIAGCGGGGSGDAISDVPRPYDFGAVGMLALEIDTVLYVSANTVAHRVSGGGEVREALYAAGAGVAVVARFALEEDGAVALSSLSVGVPAGGEDTTVYATGIRDAAMTASLFLVDSTIVGTFQGWLRTPSAERAGEELTIRRGMVNLPLVRPESR